MRRLVKVLTKVRSGQRRLMQRQGWRERDEAVAGGGERYGSRAEER